MSTIYLDTNSRFYDWCDENGYDSDTEHDRDEEVHKRGAHVSWYARKEADDTYALVTAYQDYDNGRMDIEVQSEGLKRIEKQVTSTVVTYE
ncbi:hypothetical protein D3C77_289960 [compost metagenome]